MCIGGWGPARLAACWQGCLFDASFATKPHLNQKTDSPVWEHYENMDSKRSHGKPQTTRRGGGGSSSSGSSGDSSCGSPASPSSRPASAASSAPLPGGNAFANDGSFMEMFKKKMEEEKRKKETQQTGGEERRATTEQGQTSVEKKPPPVTSFVRGLAVVRFNLKKQKKDEMAVVKSHIDSHADWQSYF